MENEGICAAIMHNHNLLLFDATHMNPAIKTKGWGEL